MQQRNKGPREAVAQWVSMLHPTATQRNKRNIL
jgi:hypothetical protein